MHGNPTHSDSSPSVFRFNKLTPMLTPPQLEQTVVTADEWSEGTVRPSLYKATVDEAVEGCECVRRVMVATRTGANVPMVADRDLRLEEVIVCVCVMMTCCYSLLLLRR